MAYTESHVSLLVFMYAHVLHSASGEDGDVGAKFIPEEKHQEASDRIIMSLPDLNEIDDGIDQGRNKENPFRPEVFKRKEQCDYKENKRLKRECACNKPRKQCVKIHDSSGTVKSTIPECVMVERCDGCCPYSTSCLPKVKEFIDVPIIFFGLSPSKTDSKSVQLLPECKTIQIEKHVKCGCGCGMSSEDCAPKKVVNTATCQCECPNPRKAEDCKKQNKSWDPSSCECICPIRIPETCSTGAFFHKIQCKCVPTETENAWKRSKQRRPTSFRHDIP